jgi:hypothetical protein
VVVSIQLLQGPLSAEKKMNLIWTSGIALAGCVPEVTDFRELVQWCVDKFNSEKRIIQLQGQQPISLAPSVFTRMLFSPYPPCDSRVKRLMNSSNNTKEENNP